MRRIDTKNNRLILSLQEYEKLNTGDEIEYESYNGDKKHIYQKIIKHLIADDEFFSYFNSTLDKGIDKIMISSTVNNELWQTTTIDTISVVKLLDTIKDFNEEELIKVNMIKESCSFKKYLEAIKGKKYQIYLDNEEFIVSIDNILNIFTLGEDEFKSVIENNNIFGIDKYKFMYIMKTYLIDNHIMNKYVLSKELINRYKKIKEYEYLDFESINYFDNINHFKYNVEINSELKNTILKNIDDNYTDIEKSIYIYIKLCKFFSYDQTYYVSGQYGDNALLHQDLNRIKKLKSSDDLIVCYEFNAIFSKLLEELKIEYTTNSNNVGRRYGKGHANLIYCKDKYIVMADSVTSILTGDLINAKFNDPLKGLVCLNKSNVTKKEFQNLVDKVYADIIFEQLSNSSVRVHDIEYVKHCVYDENVREKLSWIVKLVNDCNLKKVDSLGYMIKLKKEIFTLEEQREKINFSVIRSNIKKDKELAVIITIKDNYKNKYFYYIPNKQFIPVPSIILKQLISKHVIEYIEGSRANIPGFENTSIKK